MAKSAQELQLREAKDTIKDLRKMVELLQKTNEDMRKENAELRQMMQSMKEQIDYLTKRLFGTSSERMENNPNQVGLFNEAEAEQDPALLKEEEQEKTEEKPRKKRITNSERYKGLKTEKVYLDVDEKDKVCQLCGTPLEKIGEQFVRREIEYYSITYGCPSCNQAKEGQSEAVIVKGCDGNKHGLRGMVTPGTVAWVMYQKYMNALPLFRQERDWQQYGLNITRSTLSNWVIGNTVFLEPIYSRLRQLLIQRKFAMADETPVQVLHEKDRRAQTQSYMWVFLSGEGDEKPIRLYKYSPTRAGDTAVEFLDGFEGYIMCDGYSGYNKLKKAKRTAGWAHIRRYLIDAIPKGKQYDYALPAVQGVAYVNKLFSLEDKIQEKHKGNYDAIKEARDKQERPVVMAFLEWINEQTAVKGSRFEKALTYIQNRKDTISRYLDDGRCSFSNNTSERTVKDFVIGRKNWLFSDSVKGADASSVIYSIVATAKANEVNVYQYLKYLLEVQLPKDASNEEVDKHLPWSPEVKKVIQERTNKADDDTA